MDGKNIPDEEIAAAEAFGASVIEHWSTLYPASLWSGLADGVIINSSYDYHPMIGCSASSSKFKLGG